MAEKAHLLATRAFANKIAGRGPARAMRHPDPRRRPHQPDQPEQQQSSEKRKRRMGMM
jgi:hypothetical protein